MQETLSPFCCKNYITQDVKESAMSLKIKNDLNQKEDFRFVELLKACAKKKDLHQGTRLHAEIAKRGLLPRNLHVVTTLISMYAKCGSTVKAQKVFDELHRRNVVCWNALIAGYTQNQQGQEALKCFEKMQSEGHPPDIVTYSSILKACGGIKDVEKGLQIHDEITTKGLLKRNVMLCYNVVDMYAKCGLHEKAQEVLDMLFVSDSCRLSHSDFGAYVWILKACSSIGAIEKGRQVHKQIVSKKLLGQSVLLGNALVDMYVRFGLLAKAQQVLDDLPVRDVITWNSLITGYVQRGQGHEAWNCYERMQNEGISPDAITFVCVLKACSSVSTIEKGEKIHSEIASRGLLHENIVLGNALVDFYAKCGVFTKAQEVLNELPIRNVVSWNALISGYSQHELGKEALKCFEWMQNDGVSPDEVTLVCILKACGSIREMDKGKQVHEYIMSRGLLSKNVMIGNALVDMYAKCGELGRAQEVLDELSIRNEVSWSALIAGHIEQGQAHEALDCFQRMKGEGLSPDAVTFGSILKACGITGAIYKGEQIHDEIVARGLLAGDIVLGNALVDMYSKCGMFAKAQEVLNGLPVRNVVSWSALIAGYAQHGQGIEALNCFEQMQRDGISPDGITVLSVLNACCHSGLVNEAQIYYGNMLNKYGITPKLEHHACMVDVYSSRGLFDKAIGVVKKMPYSDYPPVWLAILSACRKWGNVELGRYAFDQVICLDSDNAVYYVLMADIYAAAGMLEDAENVKSMGLKNSIRKESENSVWIDPSGTVHSFSAGDMQHSQSRDIYRKLKDISSKLSQDRCPKSDNWVSQIVSDSSANALCGHSVWLAVGCALINTHKGGIIHVTSNVRICSDCHLAALLTSKTEKLKVIIKDANRLHIFEDGICACNDCW